MSTNLKSGETFGLIFRPAVLGRAHRRNYFRQQDLQAAPATTSLGRVLGLGHPDWLLARHRSAFCARRQVPSAHKVTHVGLTNDKTWHKCHFTSCKSNVVCNCCASLICRPPCRHFNLKNSRCMVLRECSDILFGWHLKLIKSDRLNGR